MDLAVKKNTLRLFSNGVYIITSSCGDRYGGATVTWVSQVSFKPPLVMAALRKNSNVFRCLQDSGVAVIHILGSDQAALAQRFFTPTHVENERMNGEPFREGTTAAPVLESVNAYVECRVRAIADCMGDHAPVFFEVVEAHCDESNMRPLTIAESPWEYGG